MIDEIYNKLVEKFGIREVCIRKYASRPEVTWKEFISLVIAPGYLDANPLANRMGFADRSGLSRYLTKEFPELCKDKTRGLKWHTYFLSFIGLKVCIDCHSILPYNNYHTDNSTYSRLKNTCITCSSSRGKKYRDNNEEHLVQYREATKEHRKEYINKYSIANRDKIRQYSRYHYANNKSDYIARSAKRRAAKLRATPNWANLVAIKEIYATCPPGFHVDHIVPLQNDIVCGLHCEFNLQHLSASENLSKSNKFNIC